MARTKVKLARISNESTRRTTYKKRKSGLMKKISELATLCNVNACMIIYGPEEAHPEVWPSPEEAARLVGRFKSMSPMEQCRKMMNQEGILLQRSAKVQDQLRRLEGDNRELASLLLMLDLIDGVGGRTLLDVGLEDAMAVWWMADMKLKAVQERKKVATTTSAALMEPEASSSAVVLAASAAAAAAREEQLRHPMEVAVESLQRQNWLIDDGVNLNPTVDFLPTAEDDFGFICGGVEEIIMPLAYAEPNTDDVNWL